ncbi:MAG: hypothetical protein IKN37_04205 [Bacteroidales bacterium]|nr:hypothetical protein [Bacteroidales bacterium]MBR4512416.1 hypothetical protein [Bacteroidales bacterium]MBR6919506.1 hypothetical protein [Bacteroidales bacterium]
MFKKLFLPALIALISITVFNSCNKEEVREDNSPISNIKLAEWRTVNEIDTLGSGQLVHVHGILELDDVTCDTIGGFLVIEPLKSTGESMGIYYYRRDANTFSFTDEFDNPVSLDIFPGLEAILNRFFLNE